MSQKKSGIIISYITLAVNAVSSILFTPFLIRSLGVSEYGLYQLVQSFAGYLMVMNFGTGVVVARYVAKYRSELDGKAQANFLAMAFFITSILVVLTVVIGSLLYFGMDGLFRTSLTLVEMSKAKQLYVLVVINIAVSLYSNAFLGIMTGYEKFAVTNGLQLIRVVLRYLTFILLLVLGMGSLAIVATDLALTFGLLMAELLYCFYSLKITVRYYNADRELIWAVLSFSFAVFLQAIVNQVNQNVDRVILGAMIDTEAVAIYSVALVFYTTFIQLTGIIGSVFVPEATRMITESATSEELTNLVIRPGRLQLMVGGPVLVGFMLFGKHFIKVWVGSQFLGAYAVGVILLTPVLVSLVENVANAIVDALLKRMVLSVISTVMAALNVVLTILFVRRYGYIGAAIGTSLSVVLGNVILVNIYYQKYIGLDVIRMFREIFRGTWLCLAIAAAVSVSMIAVLEETPLNYVFEMGSFITIYLFLLSRLSLNENERKLLHRQRTQSRRDSPRNEVAD